MKFLKKTAKVLLIIAGILLLLYFSFFTTADEPGGFHDKVYYKNTLATLRDFSLNGSESATLSAGWSSANITPSQEVRIAGYGLRGKNEGVHDSLYARAIVFNTEGHKAAFVTVELMMFPPEVKAGVIKRLEHKGYSEENILFSATHTHNGYGHWDKSPGGSILLGSYKQEIVDWLSDKVAEAIVTAESDLSPGSVSYGEVPVPECVRFRLPGEGWTDTTFRVVKFRKKTGRQAAIATYSAHPNCLQYDDKELSGDYPAAVTDLLVSDMGFDMAIFAAGAVGSHTYQSDNAFNYDCVKKVGGELVGKLSEEAFKEDASTTLKYGYLPVDPGEPRLVLDKYFMLRPWAFRMLLGENKAGISFLQVGNILFTGLPGDMSGEWHKVLQPLAKKEGLNLVLTSFNGSYLGYFPHQRHFSTAHPETREMNWYGKYAGAYFTELISKVLSKQ